MSIIVDIMKIVFTDLDGTLLDHETYSFIPAEKGISFLNKRNIPVVFCTSKTRKEILYWRSKIGNIHPFISENGGGIYIPLEYFSFSFDYTWKTKEFYLIRLGSSFEKLKKVITDLEKRFDITSFLQMNTEDLMKEADLSKNQAELALQREFDIPFIIHNNDQKNDIIKVIKNNGLNVTKGGRFYHLMGDNDKGKAVQLLTSLFDREFTTVETIGIGDSDNDFPMLNQVRKPFIVRKKDGSYASESYHHAEGIGPIGWQQVIEKEFKN